MIKKIKNIVLAHKILSSIALLAIVYGGYSYFIKGSGTNTETKYVVALAQKGTLITSVQGSGQVSAFNQIDVKPKVSGTVTSLNITQGQYVKAGSVLAQLDTLNAEKSIRDAKASLESAKLSLAKLIQPADEYSIVQAQNTLDRALQSKQNTVDTLSKDFEGAFNTISNTFLDLPSIISGLQDMLFTSNSGLGGGGQWNVEYYAAIAAQFDTVAYDYKTDTIAKYQTARTAYNKAFQDYKEISRSSDTKKIEAVLEETYNTTRSISEATKSANDLIQFYKDKLTEHNVSYKPYADTNLSTLSSYIGQTNSGLSSLLGAINTIASDKNSLINADRTITEATNSLEKLKNGPDPLDVQSSKLSVTQRENSLLDAQQTLDDYTVRAPFDAIVAKVNIKKYDAASSGTAIATLITKQMLAQIPLNEIDVSKIKIGQKSTVTFDAIPELQVAGAVATIDAIGTVSQGVVSYSVTIAFDTQDDRIKPGMSISASIITSVKQDILMVPNSAIKVQGSNHYVQIFDTKLVTPVGTQASQGIASTIAPRQQTVEIGLANDTNTEIISGINEGDQIVTRIIAPTTTTTTTAPSASSLLGGGRGLGR